MNHNDPPIVLAETKYLRLLQDGSWIYAQRPQVIGAMAIVAVTDDREMLLVDQYRIPVRGRVIELPAGLVGDLDDHADETVEEAAQRELIEEVGYAAERIYPLTHGLSSAGLTDESITLLMAEGLRHVGPGGGDEKEDIVVCKVPIEEVPTWICEQQRQGKYVDYKLYAGLFFYHAQRTR